MSIHLSKIRLVEVDGQVIIAPRALSVASVERWFERTEGMKPLQTRVIGLTDKVPQANQTYAAVIEAGNYDASDLPLFL